MGNWGTRDLGIWGSRRVGRGLTLPTLPTLITLPTPPTLPTLITLITLITLLSLSTTTVLCAADDPSRPLPDLQVFAQQVKQRLSQLTELRSNYVYMERREEVDVSRFGGVSDGAVKLYEVHPSPDPGNTWKRLLSVDGVPLSDAELAKNDAKHYRDVAERERQPREKREREEAEARRKEAEAIDDLFRIYEIHLVARETVNGYPTIVATLDPRPDVEPRTDEGKLMKKFRVRAWIHEFAFELVKADLEAVDDLTYGWGIIGRVHEGAHVTYERRHVDGDVWLPARQRLQATGRTLLFRTFSLDTLTEWFGYRKR